MVPMADIWQSVSLNVRLMKIVWLKVIIIAKLLHGNLVTIFVAPRNAHEDTQIKAMSKVLALHGHKLSADKNCYFRGSCNLWLPVFCWKHAFETFFLLNAALCHFCYSKY